MHWDICFFDQYLDGVVSEKIVDAGKDNEILKAKVHDILKALVMWQITDNHSNDDKINWGISELSEAFKLNKVRRQIQFIQKKYKE